MRKTFVLAAVAVGPGALALGPSASAEKPLSSPAQLERTATHVIVGEVKTVYSRVTTSAHWRQRKFVAEVAVEAVEKGDGLAKGALVYVRYWDKEWLGR